MNVVQKAEVRQWYFEGSELSDASLADRLVESVCAEFDIPANRRADLELVLCEVITNAIDHGILGLDSRLKKDPQGFEQYFINRAAKLSALSSGSILVSAEQVTARRIRISVEDSGDGFTYPTTHTEFPLESLTLAYGRGLMIIRNLCHAMTHIGNGNCIVLDFDL